MDEQLDELVDVNAAPKLLLLGGGSLSKLSISEADVALKFTAT